jgi:hypothetical protein
LSFALLTRISAWCIAIYVLRWAFNHLDLLIRWAWAFLGWLVGKCLIAGLWSLLPIVLTLRVFLWCVGVFNPEYARQVDPFPKFLPWLWQASARAATLILRTVVWFVEGKSIGPSKKSSALRRCRSVEVLARRRRTAAAPADR